MKGEDYVPKKRQKLDKVEQLRIKAEQKRNLAWDDDEVHDIGLKIIILERFFTQDEVDLAGE